MSRSTARSRQPLDIAAAPVDSSKAAEPPRRAVRLEAALCQAATDAAAGAHRSLPRQLEYWARLGRALETRLGAVQAADLLADRLVIESVSLTSAVRLDPDRVFAALERDRADGTLAAAVSRGAVAVYDIDPAAPGRLRRTLADGSTSLGTFVDGVFVEASAPESGGTTPDEAGPAGAASGPP